MLDYSTQRNLLTFQYFHSDEFINSYMQKLADACADFHAKYIGRVSGLSDNELLNACRRFNQLQDSMSGPMHFAEILANCGSQQFAQVSQEIQQTVLSITQPLGSFVYETQMLGEERLRNLLAREEFKEFSPFIRRLLMPVYNACQSLPREDAIKITEQCNKGGVSDDPYTAALRQELLGNTLHAKAKGYETASRYVVAKDFISDAEMGALKDAVHERKDDFSQYISHLFSMARSGVNPEFDRVQEDIVSWKDAEKLVLRAYSSFSPDLGAIAENSMRSGTFHLMPPHTQSRVTIQASRCFLPEIFFSFSGSWTDTQEAAHEIGHLAQAVKRNENGHMQAMHSSFVDETCATFGERLFWEFTKSKARGTGINLIDASAQLSCVMRFAIIDDFHRHAENLCSQGNLTAASLQKTWKDARESYAGLPEEVIGVTDWRADSHVLSKPFTAVAYVYGQLISDQLWNRHLLNPATFREQYIDFLKHSSSDTPNKLFASFGFDTENKNFWRAALDSLFNQYDDAVRAAMQPLGYSKQNMLRVFRT